MITLMTADHQRENGYSADAEDSTLLAALKQYFGFEAFRPHQEDIIRDSLSGRDVFALLPTGGGKSLCFQLPALVRPGLTLVVSPLIALMKDQVDGLRSMGIEATFVNSSLAPNEARARLRGVESGAYRLLYVAPERLMQPGFLADLQRWNVGLFAIDEAHCISEWGHDFRPEYRELEQLRRMFPEVPVMALTATATERVRADIIKQLRLRAAACHVASFNRPNLTYRVIAKSKPYQQVRELVRRRPSESGIVYCLSRLGAESVARRLRADGVKAAPYHAGLEKEERSANQERFLRDEVQVICATIAFGMGVHKPNIRFVVHYDLPKSVEGYYQETGRAGRDGLPSECLLLFSPGDAVKYQQFIEEKPDEREREVARQQLRQTVEYAESAACRRYDLLRYFGEEFAASGCQACDNCLSPRQTFDGTDAARKLLSAVYRIRERSGFDVGLKHIAEVLTGANTEKVRSMGHEGLSVYGAGKQHSRSAWAAIGRELVRLGYLRQASGRFSVAELTPAAYDFMRGSAPLTLTKPDVPTDAKTGSAGSIECDEALFERLRALRKRLADERGVPAYHVFSDVALRQMARDYPAAEAQLSRISGVGASKLREFGAVFMSEIAEHLRVNPRMEFGGGTPPPPAPVPSRLGDTHHETLRRFRAGQSVPEIALERGLVAGTVWGHLADAVEAGEEIDVDSLLTPQDKRDIGDAFSKLGFANIVGVREMLGERFSYGLLKIFRATEQRSVSA